ncbi:hypothetical protein [Oceanobacillus salinisoli]|uniref:hypothetical protein n=1 Tax=Oceanobacillus salinisoli TaxID=2678611 RepID=UPI0012E1F9E3|nr:hypothetical protein [Oceanobacillus salinisoli]
MSDFIDILNQARKKLNTIYVMDELDEQALDEAKTAIAKTTSYVSKLESDNQRLREYIAREIH